MIRCMSLTYIYKQITNPKGKEVPEPMATDQMNIPGGYRLAPEPKSERVQLLIRPSIKDALKKKADTEKVSLNECINRVLEEYVCL